MEAVKSAHEHVVNAIGDLQAHADLSWDHATEAFPLIEELEDIRAKLLEMQLGGEDARDEPVR